MITRIADRLSRSFDRQRRILYSSAHVEAQQAHSVVKDKRNVQTYSDETSVTHLHPVRKSVISVIPITPPADRYNDLLFTEKSFASDHEEVPVKQSQESHSDGVAYNPCGIQMLSRFDILLVKGVQPK